MSKRPKIMFVTYGGGHVNIIQHVYHYLAQNRDYELRILALTASIHVLQREGIPYREIYEYLELFPKRDEILRLGKLLAKDNYDPDSGISYESIEAYLGLSFFDLVGSVGSFEAAKKLFDEKGRAAFHPVPTMRRILQAERPDILVLTCEARMESAAGYAANELGIPVVKIDDLPEALPVGFACTLCVMNEWAKEAHIGEYDLTKTDIIVTGQPVFEQNAYIDPMIRATLSSQLRLENYKKKVLLLTQKGLERLFAQAATRLAKMAREHEDYLFIIKPHPNEPQDAYDAFACDNLYVVKDCKLNCLIDLCDVVLTHASTAGLEAVFLGKPLITTWFEPIDRFDFARYGVAITALDPIEMQEKILELCEYPEGEAQRRLREGRKRFCNKAHATKNIAEVIERLLLSGT